MKFYPAEVLVWFVVDYFIIYICKRSSLIRLKNMSSINSEVLKYSLHGWQEEAD